MKYVVVDFEMNNIRRKSEARRICTQEIIEIGASMQDEQHVEIAKFQMYVKPEYNDTIVPKITRLTGITNKMVENAPTFSKAFKMFTDWCLGIHDDARNTAKLLHLFQDEELFDQTLRKIEEVMKPSSLENTLGSMIDLSMFTVA